MLRKLDEEEYGVVGSEMWGKEVKGWVAHFMRANGLDSIIVQDVEEMKPDSQPVNQIPKEKLMILCIFNANEMFN